jgi:hypothetical protein
MNNYLVTVRASDPDTGDWLFTEDYEVSVDPTVSPDDYCILLQEVFAEYPEDFPCEEPGVDAEVLEVVEA